jgi:hypothetical protein
MRKFKGTVATNKVGSKVEFEFECDDDDTDEQIEEYFNEIIWDKVETWYKEIIA